MSQETDYEKALVSPGSVFAQPEDVLTHPALTREQRIEILRRWEYDESEIAVAEEEGMPGGESTLLQRILLALEQLNGATDSARTGPTKQHGLPGDTGDRKDSDS